MYRFSNLSLNYRRGSRGNCKKSGIMAAVKPGEELIQQGIHDLAEGRETIPALLVAIGAPRLRRLGLPVPPSVPSSPEHRLYKLLQAVNADAAHSQYNAWIRRLVNYERAAECGS